jgi:hypothetical protein
MREQLGGRVGTLCGLAALVIGCGGGSNGGRTDGSIDGSNGSIPLDQLASEFAVTVCRKAFECCDASERADHGTFADDEASCRSAYAEPILSSIATHQASLDAGRILYYGDRARRCLDAIAALPCAQWSRDDVSRRISDCLYYTKGTIAPGGACGWTIECADGICNSENTCVGRVGVGQSCQGTPCHLELACIVDASGVPTVCVEPYADGSPCKYDFECANFCVGNVCGPATFCNGV